MAWCGLILVIVDREEKVHHFWVLESRGAKRKEKKKTQNVTMYGTVLFFASLYCPSGGV